MTARSSANTSRASPLPADWTVRRGRDSYLAENGFSVAGYESDWTPASLLGVRFRVPNTRRHRRAIMWHDLHHVLTGYGTDLAGEAEVSAWECRGGLRPAGLYTGGIVVGLALAGLLIAPRRTLAAWRAGPVGGSLFQEPFRYEDALGQEIGSLRQRLGLPREGLSRRPRRLHPDAPASPRGAGSGQEPARSARRTD